MLGVRSERSQGLEQYPCGWFHLDVTVKEAVKNASVLCCNAETKMAFLLEGNVSMLLIILLSARHFSRSLALSLPLFTDHRTSRAATGR